MNIFKSPRTKLSADFNPSGSLSYTIKAGRMLRLLGWITFAFTAILSPVFIFMFIAKGEPFPDKSFYVLAAVIVLTALYLIIGAGVKKYRPWAKILGVFISLFSLSSIPIGTVIGVIALYYFIKGWDEKPKICE